MNTIEGELGKPANISVDTAEPSTAENTDDIPSEGTKGQLYLNEIEDNLAELLNLAAQTDCGTGNRY